MEILYLAHYRYRDSSETWLLVFDGFTMNIKKKQALELLRFFSLKDSPPEKVATATVILYKKP